jgi:hypothetical protein
MCHNMRPQARYALLALRTEAELGALVLIFGAILLAAGCALLIGAADVLRSYGAALNSLEINFGEAMALAAVAIVALFGCAAGVAWCLTRGLPALFERRILGAALKAGHGVSISVYECARVHPLSIVIPAAAAYPAAFLVPFYGAEMFFVGAFCFAFAFSYHNIPNSRRSIKYAVFFFGNVLVSVDLGVLNAGNLAQSFLVECAIATYVAIGTLVPFVITWIRTRPTCPPVRGELSTVRALRAHRWTMHNGPDVGGATIAWWVLTYVPIFGHLYFASRICGKQRLAQIPVLFLRSFSNRAAAATLAKAVAPAVSRTGVLAALVHPSQTAAALNSSVHYAWGALALVQPNQSWQNWFVRQVHQSMAVVVDASELGESTAWELSVAVEVLGRDRVALLVRRGTPAPSCNCLIFEYDPTDYKALKKMLAAWIEWVAYAPSGRDAQAHNYAVPV